MITKRFFFVLTLFSSLVLFANPPSLISFSAGAFDFIRSRHRTWEFSIEYQQQYLSSYRILNFRPVLGFMMTVEGATYLYGGINFDLLLCQQLILSPGFSAGWYRQGGGKNLGYPLEFRTSLELAWRWCDEHRLGLRFSHMSNASLARRNPGEESLVLFYSIPIKKGFPFK